METREEILKKINAEIEKLDDEELEKIAGGVITKEILPINTRKDSFSSPKTRRRKPLALAMGRKAAHTSFLDFLFFSNII